MFRGLLFLSFLSVLLSFVSLSLDHVSVSAQTNLLVVGVDRVSATTARIRFLNVPPSQQTYTLVQYTTNPSLFTNVDRLGFHACATFASSGCPPGTTLTSDDREVNITSTLPITSYILRGLKQNTKYFVRVAYIDTSSQPQVIGTPNQVEINTAVLSPLTTLNSLVASGGCGSLTSSGSLYYLTSTLEGTERVYTCNVVSETYNVSLSVVPSDAYASIDSTPTSGLFTLTNQTLSVTAKQVDPLTIYNNTIMLGTAGTITNFSFIVTSQSGVTQLYKLSIRRAAPSGTSEIAGPSSPVTAMIRSPSISSNYSYRALLWSGTSVNDQSWKVWSEDLTVFPFSSFNITFPSRTNTGAIDYTLATVLVKPAVANPSAGSCSNIYVALFDTSGKSFKTETCVAALNDYCSATPFGAATNWETFVNAAGQFDINTLYHPAPPTPGFAAA